MVAEKVHLRVHGSQAESLSNQVQKVQAALPPSTKTSAVHPLRNVVEETLKNVPEKDVLSKSRVSPSKKGIKVLQRKRNTETGEAADRVSHRIKNSTQEIPEHLAREDHAGIHLNPTSRLKKEAKGHLKEGAHTEIEEAHQPALANHPIRNLIPIVRVRLANEGLVVDHLSNQTNRLEKEMMTLREKKDLMVPANHLIKALIRVKKIRLISVDPQNLRNHSKIVVSAHLSAASLMRGL